MMSLIHDKLLSWIEKEEIDQLILDIKPFSEDSLNVAFNVISSSGSVIYHVEFLTNYYVGSKDYFVQSKTGKKFTLSQNQPINTVEENE